MKPPQEVRRAYHSDTVLRFWTTTDLTGSNLRFRIVEANGKVTVEVTPTFGSGTNSLGDTAFYYEVDLTASTPTGYSLAPSETRNYLVEDLDFPDRGPLAHGPYVVVLLPGQSL